MQNYFEGKRLLIIVTGSIAAFKMLDVISQLRKWKCDVRVVMTEAATRLVAPLSFEALSQQPVYTDLWSESTIHIDLAKWPDAILAAPASANSLAKWANGLADDLASTILLATSKPRAFAPAMNQVMFAHPATQKNIAQLREWGYLEIPPCAGRQACGDEGLGNLASVEEIALSLPILWQQKVLQGKKVLISVGPTRERLDPIRFISNFSSGKMGAALARACFYAGADVTVVTSLDVVLPSAIHQINVTSADEMLDACLKAAKQQDMFISAAAPCDFKTKAISQHKLKKSQGFTPEWQENTDILQTVKQHHPQLFTVGFAAETEHLLENAKHKLKNKNVDVILANLVGEGQGMLQDENAITFISEALTQELPKQSKESLALAIVKLLAKQLESKRM